MSDARKIQELENRIVELERIVANFPVRHAAPGGGAGEALPPGGRKYDVLQRIDDAGTAAWGPVRLQSR
jgi:hypothetical protein